MCKWGTDKPIYVIRRNTFEPIPDGKHLVHVDACIAAYVQRMNELGIITLDCCCGHGKGDAIVSVWPESAELMNEHGYTYVESPRHYIDENGREFSDMYLDHYIPESGITE